MSTNTPESQGQTDSINPAWKPLLDALPEPFHVVVTPHLKEWDKNFQSKLQEVRTEYEPYKPFKDANIDPQTLNQSLFLFNEFSNNPEKVIAEAIAAYELPYVDPATIEQPTNNDEDDDLDMLNSDYDITKSPQFREMAQKLEQLESGLTERQQAELQSQAVRQHEEWLAEMQKEEKYGSFDTHYVTALMSQGVDGEEAIKRYQKIVADAAGTTVTTTKTEEAKPPVVMGGDGTTGSGLPEQGINFAGMSKSDFNDSVVAMLQADAQQNNQG